MHIATAYRWDKKKAEHATAPRGDIKRKKENKYGIFSSR